MRTESLSIQVPAGLADGARVRVPGKGHAGLHGGEPGDLHITVRVEPHPVFRREGDDLHIVVPVAIHEAALGARVEVPSLDGWARVRIPPGTQSGQRFRLRERGVPSQRRTTAAIWSSRSGWCCRNRSTSDRKSCCGSSGGSTAKM